MSATEYEYDRPWARQPLDTDQSYQLFQEFLMLGPSRSIAKIARRSSLPTSRIYDMAHDGLWKERAECWDRHIEETRLSAIEAEIQEDAKAVAKRHGRLLRSFFRLTDIELAKTIAAAEQGDFPMITPRDLIRIADVVIKNERLLVGEATDRVETNQPDLDNLSLEELRQIAELQKRAGVRE